VVAHYDGGGGASWCETVSDQPICALCLNVAMFLLYFLKRIFTVARALMAQGHTQVSETFLCIALKSWSIFR
jgi:hypothetical protein